MNSPHVLVLYNQPTLSADHPDYLAEYDIVPTTAEVETVLREAGFRVAKFGLGRDPASLLQILGDLRPDVVFNLFEGNPDDGDTEAYVAGILQWLKVPFTGSPPAAMPLARDKVRTKFLMRGAGLPTADFFVVQQEPVLPCVLNWPVIVKLALHDASVGLDHASVVTTQEALDRRVAFLWRTYGPPVLVEEYIAGREINVALWETEEGLRFMAGEILFQDQGPEFWPIVTYASKWHTGSEEDRRTPPRFPADLTPELRERFGTLARQAFHLIGCRDYARVDFRLRPPDAPFILEVNPNPAIKDDAGFPGCLRAAGIEPADFLVHLVRRALARG